jgi:hypothetical protein
MRSEVQRFDLAFNSHQTPKDVDTNPNPFVRCSQDEIDTTDPGNFTLNPTDNLYTYMYTITVSNLMT